MLRETATLPVGVATATPEKNELNFWSSTERVRTSHALNYHEVPTPGSLVGSTTRFYFTLLFIPHFRSLKFIRTNLRDETNTTKKTKYINEIPPDTALDTSDSTR